MVDDSGNPVDDHYNTTGIPLSPPANHWLAGMKSALPLETLTCLLQHLVPVVDEILARKQGVVGENKMLEVLKDVTLAGLSPLSHAIVI
jgi:hypothetical protein